jgi:hypothetical protein
MLLASTGWYTDPNLLVADVQSGRIQVNLLEVRWLMICSIRCCLPEKGQQRIEEING